MGETVSVFGWPINGELLAAVIAAVAAIATAFITRYFTRQDLDRQIKQADEANRRLDGEKSTIESRLRSVERERDGARNKAQEIAHTKDALASELVALQQFVQMIREEISNAGVVEYVYQPVLIIGPRFVGKTSLLMQWKAPWSTDSLLPNAAHKVSTVPVFDFEEEVLKEFYAIPDLMTPVFKHVQLRVHDFPGEIASQQAIVQKAVEESESVRKTTQKNLGVVLVCLFDASEAGTGRLSETTISYYNAELFNQLRTMVGHGRVGIQKVVLVFNKYDLLRDAVPGLSDAQLMDRCLETFRQVLMLLKGMCNPERFCEVFTILDRVDMVNNNRGAPIALGESARGIVEAVAGRDAARDVAPQRGGTKFQKRLPDLS